MEFDSSGEMRMRNIFVAQCRVVTRLVVAAVGLLMLHACSTSPGDPRQAAIREVASRDLIFVDYPKDGTSYLSFSQIHGFQVVYLDSDGRSWLWYGGNSEAVSGRWRVDLRQDAVCWTYPANTINPVVPTASGRELCEALNFARRTIVASLSGDPFRLKTGRLPYARDKCVAPSEFAFDRRRYRCQQLDP